MVCEKWNVRFLMRDVKTESDLARFVAKRFSHMRIVEDKDGERFLEFESKEDLEEFRKMLIEAYYELNPDRKPPYDARSSK